MNRTGLLVLKLNVILGEPTILEQIQYKMKTVGLVSFNSSNHNHYSREIFEFSVTDYIVQILQSYVGGNL